MPPKTRPPYISRFSEILDDDLDKENSATREQEKNRNPDNFNLQSGNSGQTTHPRNLRGAHWSAGRITAKLPVQVKPGCQGFKDRENAVRLEPQLCATCQASDKQFPGSEETQILDRGVSYVNKPPSKNISFPKNSSCRQASGAYTSRSSPSSSDEGLEYNDDEFVDKFISSRGNEYFCEIDEDYLNDRFNLTGLNTEVQNYQYALDLITDVFDLDCDDEVREHIDKSARHLYGLVHARYIVTTRGLSKMLDKYKKADFGKCPRVLCDAHPLLPMGQSDIPGTKPVKLYCAKCEDIYNPKSSRHASIDGAYFGTSFHNILFQVYPALVPEKSRARYEPRVFGFKVHAAAALARWQDVERREMKRRLEEAGVEGPGTRFVEDASNPEDFDEEDEVEVEVEGEGDRDMDREVVASVARIEGNGNGNGSGGEVEAMQDVVQD